MSVSRRHLYVSHKAESSTAAHVPPPPQPHLTAVVGAKKTKQLAEPTVENGCARRTPTAAAAIVQTVLAIVQTVVATVQTVVATVRTVVATVQNSSCHRTNSSGHRANSRC